MAPRTKVDDVLICINRSYSIAFWDVYYHEVGDVFHKKSPAHNTDKSAEEWVKEHLDLPTDIEIKYAR